ncbi:unnamed protein product [Caenorhabditis auriculariae]|uniref:Uncharacterized protein n=1 Tax=Caenorhabditis auriculariae TaxID=2777116 RepID=A0A8S1GRI7_9PELO|nr:unnamed protein product [Caenorhabditis auriculariae]
MFALERESKNDSSARTTKRGKKTLAREDSDDVAAFLRDSQSPTDPNRFQIDGAARVAHKCTSSQNYRKISENERGLSECNTNHTDRNLPSISFFLGFAPKRSLRRPILLD